MLSACAQAQLGRFVMVAPGMAASVDQPLGLLDADGLEDPRVAGHSSIQFDLQPSQLLPQLLQGSLIATTISAASGCFQLVAMPTPQCSPSGMASALRCRMHGWHVGLAVSVADYEAAEEDEHRGLSDSDEDSGTSHSVSILGIASMATTSSGMDSSSGSGSSSHDFGAPPSPPLGVPDAETAVVLKVWSPQAANGPCLYQFELSCGEREYVGLSHSVVIIWYILISVHFNLLAYLAWPLYVRCLSGLTPTRCQSRLLCLLQSFITGSILSETVPVLVFPDEHREAALELCQLQQKVQAPGGNAQLLVPPSQAANIVCLVATVLRYVHLHQQCPHPEAARTAAAVGADFTVAAAAASGAAAADFAEAYPPSAAARVAALARHQVLLAVRAK